MEVELCTLLDLVLEEGEWVLRLIPYFHHCMISSSYIFKMSLYMTFLSPFPTSLISSARIWSCPVYFTFFNLRIAISVSTSFGSSTSGFAVCTRIVRSSPLSLFHLTVQSAYHNMQTTFVGLPVLLLSMLSSSSVISNVWFESLSYTIHFLIKCLCFIVFISNFHLLQLWFKQYFFFF